MKHLAVLLALLISGSVVWGLPATPIRLEHASVIPAGGALNLTIHATRCDLAEVTVFSGLAVTNTSVDLTNGGGRASMAMKQSGDALIVVTCNGTQSQSSFTVLPGSVTTVQAFPLAGAIMAYGEQSTTVLGIVHDEFGNPVLPADVQLDITYPQAGTITQSHFTRELGLVRTELTSQGLPGLARATLLADEAASNLEVLQLAGDVAQVALSISPACVLADGRERVMVLVDARDGHGFPVVDGTAVFLTWPDGRATVVTRGGLGTIEIPAPGTEGRVRFEVPAAGTSATLRVGGCGS